MSFNRNLGTGPSEEIYFGSNVTLGTAGSTIYPLGGKFKYFAIKIVLTADDPTVPPLVENYHVVCVPAG
jgi:hypothetical protein